VAGPILEIQDLTLCHGSGKQGIHNISFSVETGEVVILAGRNGSGKTTLIRHLNGLLRPDRGQVRLHSKDIFQDLTWTRRRVCMVFQDADAQMVADTVFDEVAFGPENLGLPREKITSMVTRILREMDLFRLKQQHPATLSGGEKRRLAIAGVLAMEPEVIIFDEPFANLDYPACCALFKRLKALHHTGHTLIIATHDVVSIMDLATRLLILDQGRIQAQGPPESLVSTFESFGIRPPCACGQKGILS
jgi:biotin transport system ATP-binding protein